MASLNSPTGLGPLARYDALAARSCVTRHKPVIDRQPNQGAHRRAGALLYLPERLDLLWFKEHLESSKW
jgi:hypothetical protein